MSNFQIGFYGPYQWSLPAVAKHVCGSAQMIYPSDDRQSKRQLHKRQSHRFEEESRTDADEAASALRMHVSVVISTHSV